MALCYLIRRSSETLSSRSRERTSVANLKSWVRGTYLEFVVPFNEGPSRGEHRRRPTSAACPLALRVKSVVRRFKESSHRPSSVLSTKGSHRVSSAPRPLAPVLLGAVFNPRTVKLRMVTYAWSHVHRCLVVAALTFCAGLQCKSKITLSGGSLGSCVDEERSQLRELM